MIIKENNFFKIFFTGKIRHNLLLQILLHHLLYCTNFYFEYILTSDRYSIQYNKNYNNLEKNLKWG